MRKYVCVVCGFIYDENSSENGTPFHELSEDYICPECDEGKDAFHTIDH